MFNENIEAKKIVAIPVDVNSIMVAYNLGYLDGVDNKSDFDFDPPTPESYCELCSKMGIAPSDNIKELLVELLSRQANEIIGKQL